MRVLRALGDEGDIVRACDDGHTEGETRFCRDVMSEILAGRRWATDRE